MPANLRIYGLADQEFRILRGTKPIGPVIGHLADAPLYESVEDEWGRRYHYAGICELNKSANHSKSRFVSVLRLGEFILPPGIIYKMT